MHPRVFLGLVVAFLACASVASVVEAVSCSKNGVTGTCVGSMGACPNTASAPRYIAMSLCVPPTTICCLPGAPAPAHPAHPVAPPPAPAPAPAPAPVVTTGPPCIKYDSSVSGRFYRGTCGSYDGSCPAGFVAGSNTNCALYSAKKKCCYHSSSVETFVVPTKAPSKTNLALQPAEKWTLEFVDDGRGALYADKVEYLHGASTVTGKLPYAEGWLRILDGTGKILESFSAVSGPMGRGLLPNQSGSGYTVSLKESPVATTGFPDETGFGFKFYIEPVKTRGFGRSALLIHCSANPSQFGSVHLKAATEGCIGLNGGSERNLAFYNMLQGYLNRNRAIHLDVKVAHNPNVGGN